MGFDDAGLQAYLGRLAARPRGAAVLGANVGIDEEDLSPNATTPRWSPRLRHMPTTW